MNRQKYIFVTTSLINENYNMRKTQYINCIQTLINLNLNEKYKIIIIENNGIRDTFLDEFSNFNINIFYTNNNSKYNNTLGTRNRNYGIIEYQDIVDCINKYNIKDNDFIIKISGRYILSDNSQFFKIVDNLDDKYNCVIKYGNYNTPSDVKCNDCITGLIGYSAFYLKQMLNDILLSKDKAQCVEHIWCNPSMVLEEIYPIKGLLGIYICPCSLNYFIV